MKHDLSNQGITDTLLKEEIEKLSLKETDSLNLTRNCITSKSVGLLCSLEIKRLNISGTNINVDGVKAFFNPNVKIKEFVLDNLNLNEETMLSIRQQAEDQGKTIVSPKLNHQSSASKPAQSFLFPSKKNGAEALPPTPNSPQISVP